MTQEGTCEGWDQESEVGGWEDNIIWGMEDCASWGN